MLYRILQPSLIGVKMELMWTTCAARMYPKLGSTYANSLVSVIFLDKIVYEPGNLLHEEVSFSSLQDQCKAFPSTDKSSTLYTIHEYAFPQHLSVAILNFTTICIAQEDHCLNEIKNVEIKNVFLMFCFKAVDLQAIPAER